MFIVTRIYINTRFIWISVFSLLHAFRKVEADRRQPALFKVVQFDSLCTLVNSAASVERAARQAGTSHVFLETAEKQLER